MICRSATTPGVVNDGSGAWFFNDKIARVFEISFVLFPEKEDAEAWHDWNGGSCDILESFGLGLEGAEVGWGSNYKVGHGYRLRNSTLIASY